MNASSSECPVAHDASAAKLTSSCDAELVALKIVHSTTVRSHKHEDRDGYVEKGETSYFLIADGHGGPQAADIAKADLLMSIIALTADAPLEDAMHAAFLELHMRARRDYAAAGTTATVVAIDRMTRWITCANVGDSLGYLVLPEKLVPLGVDHRFDNNAEEAQRVVDQGAKIGRAVQAETGQPSGPLRAFPGGLAMGRSIGDLDCGEWVLATPSVQRVQLPAEGGRVVICSDGVWDALGAEAVARIVREATTPAAAADKVVPTQLSTQPLRAAPRASIFPRVCIALLVLPLARNSPESRRAPSPQPKLETCPDLHPTRPLALS